ncbi:MAG: hypothetical protein HY233_00905 [Acidobacteriales bacterium]|nr:hypothetical protein [Candidatus Koribacter versatilis]MBI3644517.1 hypothetical protein [Terriglobales bacterium]
MNSRDHFLGKPVAIASVFLASILLVACEQSKQAAPAASLAATTEKVFVVFEGPWAFATDPKDANAVLALAPKTKAHRDLNVAASNNLSLASGTYDLSVPAHSGLASGTLDPSFAQARINAKSLQHALDDKSGRYVIRLPKPEAYVAAARIRSRVGSTYPPDASTEQNYVTQVSLRYSVSSLSGFSLAGTPDNGTFNPLLLQVDTPTIRFVIEPAMADVPTDLCSTHSRESFRDLVKFLGLSLYVDFPGDTGDCHNKDPQNPRPAKAVGSMSPLERVAALLSGNLLEVQNASVIGLGYPSFLSGSGGARNISRQVIAAMYFFHAQGGSCRAPILFLTTTP